MQPPRNTPLLLKITHFLPFSAKISGLGARHRSVCLLKEHIGHRADSLRGQKCPRVPEGSQLLHPNRLPPSRSAFPLEHAKPKRARKNSALCVS